MLRNQKNASFNRQIPHSSGTESNQMPKVFPGEGLMSKFRFDRRITQLICQFQILIMPPSFLVWKMIHVLTSIQKPFPRRLSCQFDIALNNKLMWKNNTILDSLHTLFWKKPFPMIVIIKFTLKI